MLKLYSELAAWWPLVSAPEDYAEEAAFFGRIISRADMPPSPSLLELGCGGGSNAFHLKKMFSEVTLTDIAPQMLAISRGLNPECEHVEGDMRTLRLGRAYNVVFIHDAVDYMTTLEDLARAIETASVHCQPGGLALFVPDYVQETFQSSTSHHGRDGDGRALRYLEWSYDPDVNDMTYTTEYVVLLRDANGPAQAVHEQHICGLFPRGEWLRLLQGSGFQAETVRDEYERDIFVARRTRL